MVAVLSHIQMNEPRFRVRVHANTYARDGAQISGERCGFNPWESEIHSAALRMHALAPARSFAIGRYDFNLSCLEVISGTIEQL